MHGTGKGTEVGQASKNHQLNWWEFGFELFLTISEAGKKELIETIELPDEKFPYVVIEGRSPNYFECR